MGRLTILGSASAIPVEGHENTHLALFSGRRIVLVDCSSNPIQHLRRAGIEFDRLSDIILTHFHPDHVSGVPLLLMGMWLMGRRHPIKVYGLAYTLDRMQAMMDLFDYRNWPDFYPLEFHRLPEEEMTLAIEDESLQLYTSPVKHLIPTIGLRVVFRPGAKVAAYSCDTEPCPQTVRLAQGADLLIHEASGAMVGHSSAEQAAEIGRLASAKELCLIHYPSEALNPNDILAAARKIFPGKVSLAQDFMSFELK